MISDRSRAHVDGHDSTDESDLSKQPAIESQSDSQENHRKRKHTGSVDLQLRTDSSQGLDSANCCDKLDSEGIQTTSHSPPGKGDHNALQKDDNSLTVLLQYSTLGRINGRTLR